MISLEQGQAQLGLAAFAARAGQPQGHPPGTPKDSGGFAGWDTAAVSWFGSQRAPKNSGHVCKCGMGLGRCPKPSP